MSGFWHIYAVPPHSPHFCGLAGYGLLPISSLYNGRARTLPTRKFVPEGSSKMYSQNNPTPFFQQPKALFARIRIATSSLHRFLFIDSDYNKPFSPCQAFFKIKPKATIHDAGNFIPYGRHHFSARPACFPRKMECPVKRIRTTEDTQIMANPITEAISSVYRPVSRTAGFRP